MLYSAVSVLSLALAARAAPAAPQAAAAGNSFTVGQVPNPAFTGRNGTASLLKAYAKYGIKPTRPVTEAFNSALSVSKRQDGSAPATSYESVEYLVPVSVGGQTLNLDFDTGSSDLWVFSSKLSTADKKGHNVYNSASSSTWVSKSGYSWDISYADGSGASGTVGTDTVIIGGTTVKKQAIELATQVSSTFVQDGSDGLVGLAFDSINTVSPVAQKTFFTNAASSLNSPLIGAYLPVNATGAYDFGYTDSSKYSGSITYTDVDDSNGFWEYPSPSYKIGSTKHTSSSYTAISDTGTTLILMSDAAVDNYYAQVSGAEYSDQAGGYVFQCSATLPTLSISIGSSNYAEVPADLLNFGASGVGSTCYGSLQSVGSGTQFIFGDVFFNGFYGVFDKSGPSFGFAPLA